MKTFILTLVFVFIVGMILRVVFRKKKQTPQTPQTPPSNAAPPPAPAKDAFCPNCGIKVEPDSAFCGSCGAKLK